MAAGVEDWGTGPRRTSEFGISQNPAYGLDLRQSRTQLKKQAGAVGAHAVILSKKTADAFRNRPYQSVVVFLSILNILLLFAGTTQLAWYYQLIDVSGRSMRTTVTWDRLQICDSSSANRRTNNASREVCAVVFLGDIRLDQDYIRVAGWSAFSCNLVALGFLAIAAYSSYLARVNRAADVVSTCRLCLAYQYSPLGMHAATALLVLSAFASFSSIMLTSLPNDPTTLNPKYAQEEGEAAGFGSAYGLTVTVFVIELACIGLSGFCAAEADRNPDDFGDSTATAPGFPPSRGEEAAQQFDDVYAMSADGMAEAGVPAGGKAGRVPPRRSMGGPAVRPSVAAADAATLEAVAAAVDTVHAEEVAAGLTGPRAGGDGGHVPVAAPGNPFADDLD